MDWRQTLEPFSVFYRFTSVCMCASLSSSHPSICADDEQGSIFRERVIKYSHLSFFFSNQTQLLKSKESYTEVYSSSTCLDPSPSFFFSLFFRTHGMERSSVRCCCRRTGSSSSSFHWQHHLAPPEPLLPPLPPSSSSSFLSAAGRVGINHLCARVSRCDAKKNDSQNELIQLRFEFKSACRSPAEP